MTTFKSRYPTVPALIEAPVDELAGVMLRVLATRLHAPQQPAMSVYSCVAMVAEEYDGGRGTAPPGLSQACAEAWDWLFTHGFLCTQPDPANTTRMMLTRQGRAAATQEGFAQWVADQVLPADMLTPVLRGPALRLFRQAMYQNAVFEAFKTLEVEIRDAAGLGLEHVGTKLASKAFHPETGPLTDKAAEEGERVALMNLMTGALGSYKNPHSHRRVEITAAEAREMLLMASHLLRIVETRRPRGDDRADGT